MVSYTGVVQSLITGTLIGGFYGLFALGLTLSWGILDIINMSHFAFAVLSAYITYVVLTLFGFDPFLSLIISIPVFFLIGVSMQAFFNKFRIDVFRSLIITFALLVVVENAITYFWTADIRKAPVGALSSSIFVDSFYIPLGELVAFFVAVSIVLINLAILKRTKLGLALRALAENREASTMWGVNYSKMALIVSGLSMCYVALAGLFIAVFYPFSPTYGHLFIGRIFAVTIFGGLGSITGAFIAGIILGIAESVAAVLFAPSWSPLVAFLLLMVILLIKPSGLAGR
ncbi:MAG: branched-chain amino acid ABC transporter permease [Candidatus Caldarchaeum sp.]|nr:branched-chain amino acid ABC transporter permease [Candidatus Caldarchaeum sp.]MDW8063370.1 branched-chain amino acid ABC transporter permease [Candidatus Caldarchaeum sp.]MDW8436129.1 branched-chain amino acid ABC transporter permease [Candidatus Caldarchaeum sp.]